MRLARNIRRNSARWVAALVLGGVALGAQAQQFKPLETLTDGHALTTDAQDRIYVMDTVFMHMTESRVHVFDGKTGRFLGMIPTSFNGHMQLSNDGKKIYTMTTYHERVTRGKRTDVVEIWDADGLTFEKEIILPNNRVQGLNYRNMFRQTTDGKFIILQNATPAISVAVVDVEKGEHVEEITAVAGCWSVNPLPNRPRSFMTVCGDGTLLTIDLDENGKVASQHRSERMFSVQDDPVFIAQAMVNNKAHYVSFYGTMYTADFNGDKVSFEPSWSLLDEQDRAAGWTPGGYNLLAADEGNERLYVLMHSGGAEGTHKSPAEEIWVYDLPTKKRIARVPGMGILSISVDEPGKRLLGIDGGNVHIFDISGDTPTLIRTIENAGEAALQVEPHVVMKNGG
ncbi:amine dehydrogenase large subunit [Paenalcaligenes sp. Me52]|uniref:amine dehydrogenase large subunit n=1 Tax=Paenalcaligenes sp. Me52 TaxID=3392038 RepID=UPI003D2BCCC1